MLIINAPYALTHIAWPIIKPLLSKDVNEKVNIIDAEGPTKSNDDRGDGACSLSLARRTPLVFSPHLSLVLQRCRSTSTRTTCRSSSSRTNPLNLS